MFAPGLGETGGAARRTSMLIEGLVERGWEIRAVTRAGTLSSLQITRRSCLTVVEVPGFNRPRMGAVLFVACALPLGLFWGMRARVFLAIQLLSQSSTAALCGFMLRKPFIAFATTGGDVSELDYICGSRLRALRLAMLSRAAALVAQTGEAADSIAARFPGRTVAVIPNPAPKARPAPLTERPAAVFSGRFSQEKDLSGLLTAWREILRDIPDAHLYLVGEGGRYRSVEAELRWEVENDPVLRSAVTFTGWVEDVGAYLRRADVFVFPSLSEGMSNALIEACAYGRIIVASDIPPNRAVLGNSYPLLFPPGDSQAMRAALLAAFTNGQVRTVSAEEVCRVGTLFDLDNIVSQIESLIDDATHSSRYQY